MSDYDYMVFAMDMYAKHKIKLVELACYKTTIIIKQKVGHEMERLWASNIFCAWDLAMENLFIIKQILACRVHLIGTHDFWGI